MCLDVVYGRRYVGGIHERSLMAREEMLGLRKSSWIVKPRDTEQDLLSGEDMVWLTSDSAFRSGNDSWPIDHLFNVVQ